MEPVVATGSIVGFDYGHRHGQFDRNALTTAEFYRSQEEGTKATSLYGRAVELAVEKTSAATNLNVEKVANQGRTDAINFANQSRTDAVAFSNQNAIAQQNYFNLTNVEAVKNAAATALTAAVNTAAIQASIAECCCELKELIRAEAGQTRDLINAVQTTNLAVQLVDVKNELTFARAQARTPA